MKPTALSLAAALLTLSAVAETAFLDLRAVHRLGDAEFAQGRDFSFCCTVTAPAGSGFAFRSGGSMGTVRHVGTQPRVGDEIRVYGKTEMRPGHKRQLTVTRYETLGHTETDGPIDVTIRQILDRKVCLRVVRVTGTVSEVIFDELNSRYAHIMLSSPDGTVDVIQTIGSGDRASLDALVNAEIRVTGTCFKRSASWSMHTNPIISSVSDITVLTKAPSDPFDVPPICDFRTMTMDDIRKLGRRRADGRVAAVWDANRFLITTPDGLKLTARLTGGADLPKVGDSIRVVGLPDADASTVVLTSARWKSIPPLAYPAEPIVDNIGRDFDLRRHIWEYDRNCVRTRGRVSSLPNVRGRVHLACGKQDIQIDASSNPALLEGLAVGSEVEVTGIFIIESEPWPRNVPYATLKDIVLVLRTADDIKVLSSPPWWTPVRLAGLIGILSVVLVGVLLWNRWLRRLVERRSQQLARSELAHAESDLKVDERTRLAVELHDLLSQSLTGAAMELQVASQLQGNAPQEMVAHLQTAEKTLQSCRSELKNCLWDLRSQALEEPDMTAAILKTLEPHVSSSRIVARFNVPRERLADQCAHAILCIVRELVLNALRHGQAATVRVAGCLDGNVVRFSVTDDGKGFDPKTCPGVLSGHFGLQGIRERLRAYGGRLTVASRPGETKADVEMHLPDNGESES